MRGKSMAGRAAGLVMAGGMQSWNPRRQARRRLEVQYLAYCGKRLSGRRFRRMRRDQLRWNWMLGEPAV